MPTIFVKSKTDRFRRAGLAFTRAGADYEVDAKTLKALKDEPMLVVTEAEASDLTAKDLIEKIKTLSDVAELGELFKGETRTTVKDALKARIKELKAASKS